MNPQISDATVARANRAYHGVQITTPNLSDILDQFNWGLVGGFLFCVAFWGGLATLLWGL